MNTLYTVNSAIGWLADFLSPLWQVKKNAIIVQNLFYLLCMNICIVNSSFMQAVSHNKCIFYTGACRGLVLAALLHVPLAPQVLHQLLAPNHQPF